MVPVSQSLTGKTVWICGASSGIGAALAQALADRGAHLILTARRLDRLEAVRAACLNPENHRVHELDISQPDAIAAVSAEILAEGVPDVLINNAGISQRASVAEVDMQVVRRIMEVNFFGAVAVTKAVLPAMLERGSGTIVATNSVMGKLGTRMRSSYAASKHALLGFYDCLRAEVHGAGVRVISICPGYVRTELNLHSLTADGSPAGRVSPKAGSHMPPEKVAERICRAIERGEAEVVLGGHERWGVVLQRFAPGLLRRIVRRVPVR